MRRTTDQDLIERGGLLPRGERVEIRLEVIGEAGKGGPAIFELLNISRRGMLIRGPSQLAVGERVKVILPGDRAAEAAIVWSDDRLAGCFFLDEIPLATVNRARLQGRPMGPGADLGSGAEAASDLGSRLARYRQENGLSLGDLARELDVSRQAVWFWETGRSTPRPGTMRALARLLEARERVETGAERGEDIGRRIAETKHFLAGLLGVPARAIRIYVEH